MSNLYNKLIAFRDNNRGDLSGTAIAITVFLVVVGYVLAPIGLTAVANVNTTAAGVATGSNASIWNAIVPIVLASLILAVIYHLKNESN